VKGIVGCAGYENGRRIADLDISESGGFAASGFGRFVWIGLYEPDEALLSIVQQQFGLHELAIEDAFRAHQRPKIEVYDRSVFMVLRTAQLVDGKIRFGETHIFVGKGYVVTVRHGASSSYTPVRARCEAAPELLSNGEDFVLYAIMDFVVDNLLAVVDALQPQVEDIEDTVRGGATSRETIERIAELRRDLLRLRRASAPLLEVCNRLQRLHAPVIDEAIRPYYADVSDHVVQVNENIDILRDLLNHSFETFLLLASNRQNDVTRKLAGWAAILAVPTAIAGIYGMNFEYMPELRQPWAYPLVLLTIAGICLSLYLRFRRIGWL
jgi:magnesium transporter